MADYISSHSGSQIDGAVDTVLNIQQTTGENTGYLMSQKAITDAITAAQPEIVQTTGTSETAIMSQKAITTMYDSTIQIGNSANSGSGSNSIAIGSDANCGGNNGNIAIGASSNATGGSPGIALGIGARVSAINTIAIGNGAETTANDSVAIGSNSECTEEYTISVGGSFGKRRIVNVTDPTNPQDVATKNYIDNRILTNALAIYVNATSGNDSNAGTEEAPYATLTKAISVIPKLIQASVTINVSAGEYAFPNIFGFSGYGSLTIVGAGDTTIYTNAINIGYNSLSYMQIANAQFQYTPQSSEPDKLYNNVGIIDLSGLKFTGTAETPLTSPLRISASNNVLVTNCTFNYFDTAILAISATRCIVTTLTCNNGTYAIGSYNGAIVSLVNDISGGTTQLTGNSTSGAFIYPNGTFSSKLGLFENKTIYIDVNNGSDTNDGTQGKPFKTIAYAFSTLPKLINATLTVNLANGTYPLNGFTITGFSGTGGISIVGTSAETTGTILTEPLLIQNNTLRNIYINKIRFSYGSASTNRTLSGNTGYIQFDSCNFVGTAETALANPINLSSCNTVTITSCNFNYCTTAVSIFSGGNAIINGAMNCENGTNAVTINSGGICLLAITPTGGSSTITRNTGGVVIYPNGTTKP